ncbi:MAG TPA: TonB family protein [Gammaproteobacteria bacterium]|jgi:TonB family protein
MSARPCFDPSIDPYWENPAFETALLDVVQSAIHDPVDATDMSMPGLHATVKFIFLDGVIEYPEIMQGTGDPEKDKVVLRQLASAQPPKPTGLQSDQAHEFTVDVDMPTPFERFESNIYAAIDAQKVYPRDPIIYGVTGDAVFDFDYADGKVADIRMVRSSDSKSLDQASLDAMRRAVFPPVPPAYAGKVLHLNAVFCYAMLSSAYGKTSQLNSCPVARNVIAVQGERFRQNDVRVVPNDGDHG